MRTRPTPLRWTLIAVFAALSAGSAAGADRVPGTAVTLTPPAGFSPATRFEGFENNESGAAISITEAWGSVRPLLNGMTVPKLAAQGMELVSFTEMTVAGGPAVLVHMIRKGAVVEFESWMLVRWKDARAVILVGTFDRTSPDSVRETVKSALLAATWDPSQLVDITENLPFRISETAELKIARRVGHVLTLTNEGSWDVVVGEGPLLNVERSIDEEDLSHLQAFARQRVRQTAQIIGVRDIQGEMVEVADGLPAYELQASARDRISRAPLRVYQLLIADGRRYFLVQGLIGPSQAERFVPQFREVARSLRRVK
jgi:hypothetical protein